MIVDTDLAPLIGAHRGASGDAPENTIAAFDLALEQGAELIECDVHRSADGCLVVTHDFSLNRTAGRDGQVGDLTLQELRSCDVGAWRGAPWAGQRMPTLDEVLDRYAQRVFLNVEIKVDRAPYPGIEAEVADAILGRDLAARVVVSSFDLATVQRLCAAHPRIRAGLLAEEQPDEALAHAAAMRACALHLEASLITPPRVQQARKQGLGLLAWTVDDTVEMVRLVELGVDAIVSNYPARLRSVVLSRRA